MSAVDGFNKAELENLGPAIPGFPDFLEGERPPNLRPRVRSFRKN